MAAELPIPGEGPLSAFLKVVYGKIAPLEAIRARAPQASVTFIDGHDPQAAAQAAAKADVVIAFGEQWRTEAIDLASLALMDNQDATIAAVAAANRNTVVVLETGGAVAMPWLDKVGAVIEAWYPGEQGAQAIARVLFGDVSPSGRLPVTFPASLTQAPRPEPAGYALAAKALADAKARGVTDPFGLIHSTPAFAADYREGADVGYRWYQRSGAKPLFPFGFGLSYTHFALSGLTLTGGASPKASFAVTNAGHRAGVEVAQVYASIALDGGPALPRLVGFARVALKPGETRRIEVAIEPQLLRGFDAASGNWGKPVRSIPVTVSQNAETPVLRGTLRLP
jgi:beta-glucosidase